MIDTSKVLQGPVFSWPGHLFWEWNKNHSSRLDIEIAQLALVTFSGMMAYFGPKKLTFSVTALPLFFLLLGGAVYGMRQEQELDFDYDVEAKELAMKTIRLVLAPAFGSTLGGIPRIFSTENIEVSALWLISAVTSGMFYPFLTFLDWFVQAKPYKGD